MKNMPPVTPASAEDLARLLHDAASRSQTIALLGKDSKHLMAGPCPAADITFSTVRLNRVLEYEPNDLTISVEAGMPWADLQELLGRNRQMIALDPPFSSQATVGGVIASDSSGPFRRNFGTARDLVIGMRFAMLDGKLVEAGGMVVKNVAGLDMGKMMIGSFGTLAAITSVNFRLHPLPEQTRTFLFASSELDGAIEKRNQIVRSVLRPLSIDLLSPAAAARLGGRGYLLATRAGGSQQVLARYARELAGAQELADAEERAWWNQIREFPSEFLRRQPNGVVLRVSTSLNDVGTLLGLVSGPCVSRAGSGVTYVYLSSWQGVTALWRAAAQHGWTVVVEFAPEEIRSANDLWLSPRPHAAATFDIMKRVKQMFDPENLLNRSRLYGRL